MSFRNWFSSLFSRKPHAPPEQRKERFRLIRHDFLYGQPPIWDVQVDLGCGSFSSLTDDCGYSTEKQARERLEKIIEDWHKPKITTTVLEEREIA